MQMRAELEPQTPSEGNHLRRNHGVRSRARHHHHAGIVNDATRAAPIVEAYRLEQEVLRLKARKPRVVVEEQPARVGQGQAGTLRSHRLAGPRRGRGGTPPSAWEDRATALP